MKRKRARSLFVPMVLEALESRALLSGSVTAFNMPSRVSHGAAVDASAVKKAVTHTALEITTGTLGQPTVFTVTVSAGTAAGPPVGTVNLLDHGKLIQTLTLVPTSSANAKFAESTATYTLTPTPGGVRIFSGITQLRRYLFRAAHSLRARATRHSMWVNLLTPRYRMG